MTWKANVLLKLELRVQPQYSERKEVEAGKMATEEFYLERRTLKPWMGKRDLFENRLI